MAYKNLTNEAMLLITGAWIDPARERPVLEKHPLLAHMLGPVEEAHRGVAALSAARSATTVETEIAKVRDEIDQTDVRHDDKAVGAHALLHALGLLSEDPAQREHFHALRDRVFPRGEATATQSHTDEAGHVAAVKPTLDGAVRESLQKIHTVEGRTALDEVDAWIAAGERIGELLARRAVLEQTPANDNRSPAQRARNKWIKTVHGVASNLQFVQGLSDEEEVRVFGPLRREEAKADRRVAARNAPAAETPKTAPTAMPGEFTPARAANDE